MIKNEYIQKAKELNNICSIIQLNISSRYKEEHIFYNRDGFVSEVNAGTGSFRHFRINFNDRLAEVFTNLSWALENANDENDKNMLLREINIFKEIYQKLQNENWRSEKEDNNLLVEKMYRKLVDTVNRYEMQEN